MQGSLHYFRNLGVGSFLGPGKGSHDLQQPPFLHNDWLSEKWPQELTRPGTTQACQVSEDPSRREQGVCSLESPMWFHEKSSFAAKCGNSSVEIEYDIQ